MSYDTLKINDSENYHTSENSSDSLYEIKSDITSLMNYFMLPNDNLDGSFSSEIAIKNIDEYLTKHGRYLYSEITIFVIKLLQNKQDVLLSYLISNLDICLSFCLEEKNNINKDMQKNVLKLWDHVNLANNQYTSFYQEESKLREKLYPDLDDKLNNIHIKQLQLDRKYQKTTKNIRGLTRSFNNKRESLVSEMISMISIFVGIAFVMFGGMTLLNNLFDFSNMTFVPVTELLCLGSLVGIIMISIIYAFMIFILRVTSKYEKIKGKSLLNGILLTMLLVLSLICMITFYFWYTKPSVNIYGSNENTQNSISIEQNNNYFENIKEK